MINRQPQAPIRILLIEDNPGDVRLIREAIKSSKLRSSLTVAEDGCAAFRLLRQQDVPRSGSLPDLIVLDLNLPRTHGCEVLAELKADPNFSHIPVVILTSSRSEEDVRQSYENRASLYLTKPTDLTHLVDVVETLDSFWFTFQKSQRGNGHET